MIGDKKHESRDEGIEMGDMRQEKEEKRQDTIDGDKRQETRDGGTIHRSQEMRFK